MLHRIFWLACSSPSVFTSMTDNNSGSSSRCRRQINQSSSFTHTRPRRQTPDILHLHNLPPRRRITNRQQHHCRRSTLFHCLRTSRYSFRLEHQRRQCRPRCYATEDTSRTQSNAGAHVCAGSSRVLRHLTAQQEVQLSQPAEWRRIAREGGKRSRRPCTATECSGDGYRDGAEPGQE